MGRLALTDESVPVIAERFRVLSEPARLHIIRALQNGERTVNALVAATGLGQANTSKHLQQLHAHGFVQRRKDGLFVYYMLADRQVIKLCDVVGTQIASAAAATGAPSAAPSAPAPSDGSI
jgi:DNA-binding transcriptional ArsR family regulator